jgi:hypothetical protein
MGAMTEHTCWFCDGAIVGGEVALIHGHCVAESLIEDPIANERSMRIYREDGRLTEGTRLLAIETAARAFVAQVGETSDDIPGHLRPALLALRVALARET